MNNSLFKRGITYLKILSTNKNSANGFTVQYLCFNRSTKMRTERLELSREYPLEPKSSASTNFATTAILHSII